MDVLKQFSIIMIISFAGEIINMVLPLPVPSCIYGLLIMLIALLTGILPITSVEGVGRWFLQIMPLLFIPAGIGIMDSFDVLKPIIIPIFVITFLSTIIVMIVSGKITDVILNKEKKGDN